MINWPAHSGGITVEEQQQHLFIYTTKRNTVCNQGNNFIPYVKEVRDCSEVRTCEERERQRPGGMRGPGKEQD